MSAALDLQNVNVARTAFVRQTRGTSSTASTTSASFATLLAKNDRPMLRTESRQQDKEPAGAQVLDESRKRQIKRMQEEIASTEQWIARTDGKIDPTLAMHIKASKERLANMRVDDLKVDGFDMTKIQMEMSQHLNLQYLALQDKLGKGVTGLLSNLLKKRSDTVRESIRNAGGG